MDYIGATGRGRRWMKPGIRQIALALTLVAMLTAWGAVPVLLLVIVIAASLISGMPLRSMGASVARAAIPVREALRAWFGDLFRISADDEEPDDPSQDTSLFDQDADGQGLPTPKPKRARKKVVDGPTMVLPPTFDPAAPTEQLEIDLTWIENEVCGRPYGLDLLLPQKYEGADQGGLDRDALRQLLPAEHQAFVDDILARYQVPDLDPSRREAMTRIGGMSVSPKGYEPLLDVAFAGRE